MWGAPKGALARRPPWHFQGNRLMRAISSQVRPSSEEAPTYEDLRIESAVLSYVASRVGDHPTIPQVVRELESELEEETGAAIERAIRELVRGRFLRCEGAAIEAVQ